MLNKDTWITGIFLAVTVWLIVFYPAILLWPTVSGQTEADMVKAGLLASIPNIVLMRYFFVKKKHDKTAKGMLTVTFILIIGLFILHKFGFQM
ncbi:MAG: hypothetical protein Q7J34_05455 [Bacteroidales bacterium]|jgi:hypothetical protein|nr:hypothetical protein [Bacteroidales bacterium]